MKLVKDLTYDELSYYGNARACDGRWNAPLAFAFLDFTKHMPRFLFKKKRDKFVREHIGEIFNLEDFPNMLIDIETGEINPNKGETANEAL